MSDRTSSLRPLVQSLRDQADGARRAARRAQEEAKTALEMAAAWQKQALLADEQIRELEALLR